MKRLHVVFKLNKADTNSRGETFEGYTIVDIIIKFEQKYPEAIFMAAYSPEEISPLIGLQNEHHERHKIDHKLSS